MMRGYKCKNKSASEILTTLGFDPNVNRGWVLLRTAKRRPDKPCQMHALVYKDTDGSEYIDIHADYLDGERHVTKRSPSKVKRWNELFYQIDHDLPCNAGRNLKDHYGSLKTALERIHT